LEALRTLSDQLGALTVDHNNLKTKVNDQAGGASRPPHGSPAGTVLAHKFEYVDLFTLIPQSGAAKDERDSKSLKTIESFDQWLEAWTTYKTTIVLAIPIYDKELASYRNISHKANRKFLWAAVYNFDTQYCRSLEDIPRQFDKIDTMLYATILDSSAVRCDNVTCH